jgi:hypothetical protein
MSAHVVNGMSQNLVLYVRVNAIDDQLSRYSVTGGVGANVGDIGPSPSTIDSALELTTDILRERIGLSSGRSK